MQHGITLIETCIAILLLMLAIPCILNSFQNDHKNNLSLETNFKKSLKNISNNCLYMKSKNINILKCKTLDEKNFYKIQ